MKLFTTYRKRWWHTPAALLFWLLAWQMAAWLIAKPILLAGPVEIAQELCILAVEHSFWLTVAASLWRILLGYTLGVFVGIAVAILCAASGLAHAFLKPVLEVLKAAPVASFIILLLIWIGKDDISVITCAIMVLPLVAANVQKGIVQLDARLLEMAKAYRLPKRQKLKKLIVPSLLPYFLPAASTAMGFAWKAGVAAEVLAVPKNTIGTALYNAKIYLETPRMLAWTAVIIILSLLLDKTLSLLVKKALGKQSGVLL